MTDPQVRVLCVDDDPTQLEALNRVLRRRYDIVTATNPVEALSLVKAQPQFAAVVSDLQMPAMNGIAFLTEVRRLAPDTVRLLLTGKADISAAIAAVNDGQIFRFLQKPCAPNLLVAMVQAAVGQHDLIVSERVLLERTLHGSIAALVDVLSLAQPAAFGRANRVKRLVAELAESLEVQDQWQVEVAAMLSQIGCIGVPLSVAEKLSSGASLTEEETRMVDELPQVAARIIETIPRLEGARDIILGQGLAFVPPRGVFQARQGEDIPIGARLLSLALNFDHLVSQGFPPGEAIRRLEAQTGRYDPRALNRLAQRYGDANGAAIHEIRLTEVVLGMVFVEDVRTTEGVLLVARGQEVRAGLVTRILNSWADLAIAGPIRVTRPVSAQG